MSYRYERIDGGSYCENLPTGEFFSQRASDILTHIGPIPYESDDRPLYTRMTNVPIFQLAGQSWGGRGTLHYTGTWHTVPRVPNGVNGVIFDLQGRLLIVEPGPGATSQGYRYIDQQTGEPVLGDWTYNDLHPFAIANGVKLGEWTKHGDVVAGQFGYYAAIQLGNEFYLFPDANGTPLRGCTFVRFNREGNNLAVAFISGGASHLYWLTRDEITRLPRWTDDAPAPPTPTPPLPPPPPPPESTTMELPKPIYDTYKAVAEKFASLHASPNDDDRREAHRRGVQTIRARHRGEGELDGTRYVVKSEHASLGSPTKDALGFVDDGESIEVGRLVKMHMFDMIGGSSRSVNKHPIHSHNFAEGNEEAYITELVAKDWLAGEVPEPGEPEPGKPPVPTDAVIVNLSSLLAPLREKIAALEAEVQELKARPTPEPGANLPRRIALRGAHGNYLTAEDTDAVSNRTRNRGGWEEWDLEVID